MINKLIALILVATLITLLPFTAVAYPLDGEEESGIHRLKGYSMPAEAAKLKAGQLWHVADVKLSLIDYQGVDFDALEQDQELSNAISAMLSKRDASYSMVIVDYSDVENLRWAGLRPDLKQNPGSVGKLLCMTALFHALSETFPEPAQRAELLKNTMVQAGDWVTRESHSVPKWNAELNRNTFSVINQTDIFSLSEWIDHAISPSANAAGAIIWREAMLVKHFGKAYPVDAETRHDFFAKTSKTELASLARSVITEPLTAAAIDTSNLQQGSMFTSAGKQKVPGITSFATTRELARLMFRMEQGKLVDAWSSLQMKKYMYLTKRRYRYAYAPELNDKAVYFKSGSLYACKTLEDGTLSKCGKYMGDKQNLMNSIAIVESKVESKAESEEANSAKYIAALMSNVFGVNSAWDHSRIGAATDAMVTTRKPQTLKENASQQEISESGKSE